MRLKKKRPILRGEVPGAGAQRMRLKKDVMNLEGGGSQRGSAPNEAHSQQALREKK